MGDADLQAAMTGLQEVLPILEQAQHLLRDGGGQKRKPEIRGWSSTWGNTAKARLSPPFILYLGFG